jgi:hypothetical protein
VLDFVYQRDGHRLQFDYGTPIRANFVGESRLVRWKDHVLLRNKSGRVGIWHLYSVIYQGPGKFTAVGRLVGYEDNYDIKREGATEGAHLGVGGITPAAFGDLAQPMPEHTRETPKSSDYLDRRA